MPILILSTLVQLALIVHVVKTSRSMTWIYILLFFPVIGAIAYLIAELIPEWSNSPRGHSMRRGLSKTLNPDRDFKHASRNLAIADTVQNALALGRELLERGAHAEALSLFQHNLSGVHATDPELLFGLAQAHFGLAEYPQAQDALDRLKEHNPGSTSAEGHLLYARTLEGLGQTAAAIAEYEALAGYYSGPEPACRLARIYKQQGNTTRASQLFQEVLTKSEISGKHYNKLYREWIQAAREEGGH